ncbi:MAG: hypothetical protein JSW16_07030 [Dehalococcoidales bacterium]|nr:MAG: hypothetical protein JSW16_07030 [Dehalococcoidales bacterium]
MLDISAYRGIDQFGKAYAVMMENDAHAPGSVDRLLIEKMVRLCTETAEYLYSGYTPTSIYYKKGTRPVLEEYVEAATTGSNSSEESIQAITLFTSGLQVKAPTDLDSIQVGGTEEDIIAWGSDWCTDVARVGCALNQVAGFPCRMVSLFNTDEAYSGHVIIEVYRAGAWGAIDPLTNVIYYRPDGKPASAWDLMANPVLIECHWKNKTTPYTTAGQFGGVAISNYFVWEREEYDYTVSGINEYYRSVLEMEEQGWPGGLRWIHGEED